MEVIHPRGVIKVRLILKEIYNSSRLAVRFPVFEKGFLNYFKKFPSSGSISQIAREKCFLIVVVICI